MLWKRLVDLSVSLVLLVLFTPLVLVAALLVKLTSRGPVFYSQTRVGRGGRLFTIYKIRTMYHNCERYTGACWARPDDPRILPVGRVLRRLHLDELPQLWNILRGDMSLIGPRPERPEFVPQLEQAIPHYRERLRVLPGVTGLAQVHLPPDTDLNSVRRKLAYDLYYIRHIGWWTDLRLIVATVLHVVRPLVLSKYIIPVTEEDCARVIPPSILPPRSGSPSPLTNGNSANGSVLNGTTKVP
jgi:lipopolysaccharide/colanic/teichoic acid biosynthesis glycosyltransferase